MKFGVCVRERERERERGGRERRRGREEEGEREREKEREGREKTGKCTKVIRLVSGNLLSVLRNVVILNTSLVFITLALDLVLYFSYKSFLITIII